MDQTRYQSLAKAALRTVEDAFDDVDADEADLETAGDVITITFGNGSRCVVNTQSPTQQIWVAGNGSGWHFAYDESRGRWLDDRGAGDELFQTITHIAAAAGVTLELA